MDPMLGQWLPVIVMTLAILFGLLYNNRRLDDFRELLKSEVARSENNVLRVLAESEIKFRGMLSDMETRLLGVLSGSETRLLRMVAESENNVRSAMAASEKTVLEAIHELRVDVAKLEVRVANLERPLISRP